MGIEEQDETYSLTEKQLQDLVKKDAQVLKAEEQKRKAKEELNRWIAKNPVVFVEIPDKDKNILQKIAKGLYSIFEWKWSLEKEENIRKRNIELFKVKQDIENSQEERFNRLNII